MQESLLRFNVLAYPVKPTRCGTAVLFIQYTAEIEKLNAEKIMGTPKAVTSRLHRMLLSVVFYVNLC